MAPLSQAKQTTLLRERDDGTKVYGITLDPEWTVAAVPFGGYAMCIALNAAIQYQRGTPNEDPLYVTCFFMKALVLSETAELVVKRTRPGKGTGRLANLSVKVYQYDTLRYTAHMVFGNIASERGYSHPSEYQPICPLNLYPGSVTVDQLENKFPGHTFKHQYDWKVDRSIGRDKEEALFGAWTQYRDGSGTEKVEADTVPIFLDITVGPEHCIADGRRDFDPVKTGDTWYPSIVLSLEFKVKFPLDTSRFSSTTLGQYSRKTHARNGRYTDQTELWTAPCRLGDQTPDRLDSSRWKEKMICAAIGGQMGLMVPAALNRRHREPSTKL